MIASLPFSDYVEKHPKASGAPKFGVRHYPQFIGTVFVRINGETHYLWRAVDHEGEVLEIFATKRRDRKAALRFGKQ